MNWGIFWSAIGAIFTILAFCLLIFLEWNGFKRRINESKIALRSVSKLAFYTILFFSLLIGAVAIFLFFDTLISDLKIFSDVKIDISQIDKTKMQVTILFFMFSFSLLFTSMEFFIKAENKSLQTRNRLLIFLFLMSVFGLLHALKFDLSKIYRVIVVTAEKYVP